jgi:hypothetical protein
MCFDVSHLEKLVDNFSKPKLENGRKHVKLKGIENTLKNHQHTPNVFE